MRAENKVNYDPEATVASVGASQSYGLIKNHAFIDGNKRIGLAVLVVFLNTNGFRLIRFGAEETAMVWRRARRMKRSGRLGWGGMWGRCRQPR